MKILITLCMSSLLTFILVQPVFAAGTPSDTDITNQSSISYTVGGILQSGITSNIVTFKVDAKVDLTVTGTGGVNVTPSQTSAVLEFTVTNTGNETYDFSLDSEAGTEAFVVPVAIHVDTNSNGIWDGAATDLVGASLDNIAPDTSVKVWLVGTIPATATNTQTAAYRLRATALLEAGTAIPAQTADGVGTKQYVYADGAGPHSVDVARDKNHSAELIFTVQTASLTITKSSVVIWDPINLAVNPLHIPGAIVEYTIIVANGSGTQVASAIEWTDTLNSNLTIPTGTVLYPAGPYAIGSTIQLIEPNGTVTNLTNATGDDAGSVSGNTITVTGAVLNATESATVKILAEIK